MEFSNLPDVTNPNFTPVEEPMGYMVNLRFEGKNLKDLDTFSKSDPQVVVYLKDNPSKATWNKAGETEVIDNNLNPSFKTVVEVFYQFEMNQQVRIDVMDSDGGKPGTGDLIGRIETSLGTLVGSKDFLFQGDLKKDGDKSNRGKILVTVEPVKASQTEIEMKLGGRNLTMNTTCFCISSINPYIVLFKTFKAGGKTN
jgi:hypothetical protein